MNKYLLSGTLAILTLAACNKTNQGTSSSGGNEQFVKLYEKSMKLKDFPTAITAIQMILVSDSTNNLRDSLPELYGATSNVHACFETNEDALKRHPKEEKFKNIKVLCLQQMGDVEGQFMLLKDLYETTNKPQYIAQIASIQIATNNLPQAKETIDSMLIKYNDSKDSLEVFIDEANKQNVPVKAAAWNMKGYIYMQEKNIDKAKECYFKALEIYPDFVMPKRNLEMIFSRRR